METVAKQREPWGGRRAPLFTPETAREASLKGWAKRKAAAAGRPLATYRPVLPEVSDEAARALLPRILSDEIAFRSEMIAVIHEMRGVIVQQVRENFYDSSKQTLPQLVTALAKTVELSLKIVDDTKGLDLTGTSTSQVSGLFAKAVILRRELVRMGIMDQEGNYKQQIVRAAEESQTEPGAPGDTIGSLPIPEHGSPGDRAPEPSARSLDSDDASAAVADATPQGEEGVL